jgi:hypothetical protein
MGPVPRRGTHAPVRAPHGEHADAGQDEPLGLVARPGRRAEPGPGVGVRHRARDADGLPYKLGSSRRVPRTPRPFRSQSSGPKNRENDDACPHSAETGARRCQQRARLRRYRRGSPGGSVSGIPLEKCPRMSRTGSRAAAHDLGSRPSPPGRTPALSRARAGPRRRQGYPHLRPRAPDGRPRLPTAGSRR